MAKAQTVDLATLERLRDYHVAEAKRLDDALALIRDAARRSRHVARQVQAVAQWANGHGPPAPKKARPTLRGRRAESAKFLNSFSRTEPRVGAGYKLGSFMRHGYLVAKGDGYVRTAKPFSVRPVRKTRSL